MNNRIAMLRKEKGLTLDQMQRDTGINRVTISQYERGKREPKLATWNKLAAFFNVTVGYLQGVSNLKDPETLTDFDTFINSQKYDSKSDSFNVNRQESINFIKESTMKTAFQLRNILISKEIGEHQYEKYKKIFDAINDIQSLNDINERTQQTFFLSILANSGDASAQKLTAEIDAIINRA